MHWYASGNPALVWQMHLLWGIFWLGLAALVAWLIGRGAKTRWFGCTIAPSALAIATLSCWVGPSGSPVPVEGTQEDVAALSGEWAGHYWSEASGRRGIIRFLLPEHADSGQGEIEITFSPSLRLMRDASADPKAEHESPEAKPCTTIEITVVRIEGDSIRGTTVPYWDPDCDCRAQSTFQGKRTGNRIDGRFSTKRASSDPRILVGQWEAERKG
jgi:hypothetical protein